MKHPAKLLTLALVLIPAIATAAPYPADCLSPHMGVDRPGFVLAGTPVLSDGSADQWMGDTGPGRLIPAKPISLAGILVVPVFVMCAESGRVMFKTHGKTYVGNATAVYAKCPGRLIWLGDKAHSDPEAPFSC